MSAEHERQVASQDAEARPCRPIAQGEGNRDPGDARVEEAVAEQEDAMRADRHESRKRDLLVDFDQVALHPGGQGKKREARTSPRMTALAINTNATIPAERDASHHG